MHYRCSILFFPVRILCICTLNYHFSQVALIKSNLKRIVFSGENIATVFHNYFLVSTAFWSTFCCSTISPSVAAASAAFAFN